MPTPSIAEIAAMLFDKVAAFQSRRTGAIFAKLEAALEALTARLNEHDARIQQVSEQLEWKTPATRLAVSNR